MPRKKKAEKEARQRELQRRQLLNPQQQQQPAKAKPAAAPQQQKKWQEKEKEKQDKEKVSEGQSLKASHPKSNDDREPTTRDVEAVVDYPPLRLHSKQLPSLKDYCLRWISRHYRQVRSPLSNAS